MIGVSMRTTLCRDGDYVIEHEYEQTYLRWPGGAYPLGDHYGDPTCAVTNAVDGWCVTGGEGLVITLFEDGLPAGGALGGDRKSRQAALWRRRDGVSPPEGPAWFIYGAWFAGGDLVQVAVDPGSDHAGLYEVDVRTLAWRKV
jgi:hypothetical protein